MYALSAGLTSHANLEPRLARLHVPPIAGVGSETQLVYTHSPLYLPAMVGMSDCGELLQELVKLAKVCPPLLADIEVSVCRLAVSHCLHLQLEAHAA